MDTGVRITEGPLYTPPSHAPLNIQSRLDIDSSHGVLQCHYVHSQEIGEFKKIVSEMLHLVWDVVGGVMGVVWGVANFTALLFFPGGSPVQALYTARIPFKILSLEPHIRMFT